MLRKVTCILAVCFLTLTSVVFAENINLPDILSKLPGLNQAVIFSFKENTYHYATTITLAEMFDKKMKIDVGYTPEQELIALTSINLLKVKNYITFPILDLVEIEPFLYVGLDRMAIGFGNAKGNNEFDFGCGVKLCAIKF